MFYNLQGEYRAVIALKWLACPERTKIAQFVMPKMSKITHNLLCKNVENPATFVEGFGPEFQARGSFMKS